MHVDPALLVAISRKSRRFYRIYTIPKNSGGKREIRQPNKTVKAIQAWILRSILDKLESSPYATAYVRRKGLSDNVLPHRFNRYFICIDLKDFFPSISSRRVAKVFSLLGYSRSAATILSRLCTCKGNLPQGAVTSPALSNLIASKLDRRIAGYTSKRNIVYTRYSDDITLSSNNRRELIKSLPVILNIIKTEHFKPNLDKLRVLGPRRRCYITGLVKNSQEAKFGIGKWKKSRMRAVMHHHVFNLKTDVKYTSETSILGWLNYVEHIDRDSYAQMNRYWNRLREKSKPSLEK